MTQQMSLFGDRVAEGKARMWQEIRERQAAVRKEARQARDEAFRAWFRQRAKEFGVVNAKTRPIITEEAIEFGKRAAYAVYRRHGYTDCTGVDAVWYPEENVHMPEPCERLASPGFTTCPDHTPLEG